MKAVVQRVIDASVTVNGTVRGSIDFGLLVYLGVAAEDTEKDADWLAEKIAYLRIFNDYEGTMNLSLKDILEKTEKEPKEKTMNRKRNIGVLAISQFTLLGDAKKGRRPSWHGAAGSEKAKKLYEYFILKVRGHGLICENGEFQAIMKVSYTNDGPVTILLDSK